MVKKKTVRGAKALSPRRTEAARAYIRFVVDRDFEGAIGKAAGALGLSHATLSDILRFDKGIGVSVIEKVADFKRVSIDEVIGRKIADLPTPPAADLQAASA